MYMHCRNNKTNGPHCQSPATPALTPAPALTLVFAPDTWHLKPETCFGEAAKTNCEAVPTHLTYKDSIACSHSAARVQPLCNCTVALKPTH